MFSSQWVKWTGLATVIAGTVYDNVNLVLAFVPDPYTGKIAAAIGLVTMVVREVAKQITQPKE